MNENVIFAKCGKKILLNCDNKSLTEVNQSTSITYSHASEILYMLEVAGLVAITTRGRKRIVALTDKGIKIKESILAIDELLKEGIK